MPARAPIEGLIGYAVFFLVIGGILTGVAYLIGGWDFVLKLVLFGVFLAVLIKAFEWLDSRF